MLQFVAIRLQYCDVFQDPCPHGDLFSCIHELLGSNSSLLGSNSSSSGSNESCDGKFTSRDSAVPSSCHRTVKSDLEFLNNGQNFYAYVTPFIILVGIVGNSVSLRVFCSARMRKMSASIYLGSLAISDTFVLLCYVLVEWLHRGMGRWPERRSINLQVLHPGILICVEDEDAVLLLEMLYSIFCFFLSSYAVLTCEIKLFQIYFGLRRRPSEVISVQRVKTCLKLFQNYFAGLLQLANIFRHVHYRWNNLEIILELLQRLKYYFISVSDVVTPEIRHWNNLEIISVFYFTCNQLRWLHVK